MAKRMFYSLSETAQKLAMSEDAVRQLVESGQLQEFRDRDRLVFKVDQVDLLAGGPEDVGSPSASASGVIPLAESGVNDAISLAGESGTGLGLEPAKDGTGISVFDTDATDEADPSAVTQVTSSTGATDLGVDQLEPVGSGSGLLDMTREADDTSLGVNLLDDAYGQQAEPAADAGDASGAPVGAMGGGALFESAEGDAEPAGAGAGLMVLAEPYDGPGSGLVGGLAFGAVVALALTATVVLMGLSGATGGIIDTIGGNLWPIVGGLAGVVAVSAILGWFLGKRS